MEKTAIDGGSMLGEIVGATAIVTNSSHHQAVDRLAPVLKVVARSADGIVEALEPLDPAWWLIAVQISAIIAAVILAAGWLDKRRIYISI